MENPNSRAEQAAFAELGNVLFEKQEPVKREIPNMLIRSLNLQDMCLVAVVRDINYFVYNKAVPSEPLAFLFRTYLDQVFSKHNILKGSINEDRMLWFLNRHAKKVNLSYFYSERIIHQLKEIGEGITSLNLEDSKATVNELNSIICCLPHVVNLDLRSTFCTDETLTHIQYFCPNLESLNISHCWNVTDSGMENLCLGKLMLKNLDVTFTGVDVFGIIPLLDYMPSLECIKHLDLTFFVGFVDDEKRYNLTELIFDSRQPLGRMSDSEIIEEWVKKCPNLKKLHFQHSVNVNVLNNCAHFQNLEEIKIKVSYSGLWVSDVLAPILPLSKNLKTLILSSLSLSPLKLLQCFENLENLYLKDVSFTPFEKEDVKITKSKLLTLVVKNIDMKTTTDYEGVVLLISLGRNVTKLYLKYIDHLPSEIFDVILNSMRKLTLVNFEHTHFDLQYIYPFLEIPSMTTIVMDGGISAVELFEKCTLSWRSVRNSHCKNELSICADDEDNHGEKYCYFKNDVDESDAVSDKCYTDSGSDSDD